jgi:hypothetical protein
MRNQTLGLITMSWSLRKILPAVNPPPAPTTQPAQPPSQRKKKPHIVVPKRTRKTPIPTAFREQIWIRDCGRAFESKCRVTWCQNRMTVWDFQAGHNIPESRGGKTVPDNLIPICARCNTSMGNRYTIDEWNALSGPTGVLPLPPSPSLFHRLCSCFT